MLQCFEKFLLIFLYYAHLDIYKQIELLRIYTNSHLLFTMKEQTSTFADILQVRVTGVGVLSYLQTTHISTQEQAIQPMGWSWPRFWKAIPYLIPSEKAEISVVIQSRGRHVNMDIRVQFCDPRAHCLPPEDGWECEKEEEEDIEIKDFSCVYGLQEKVWVRLGDMAYNIAIFLGYIAIHNINLNILKSPLNYCKLLKY